MWISWFACGTCRLFPLSNAWCQVWMRLVHEPVFVCWPVFRDANERLSTTTYRLCMKLECDPILLKCFNNFHISDSSNLGSSRRWNSGLNWGLQFGLIVWRNQRPCVDWWNTMCTNRIQCIYTCHMPHWAQSDWATIGIGCDWQSCRRHQGPGEIPI